MNTSLSQSVHAPDARVLPAVWRLLLLRLRISWNSFRHAKLKNKIGIIFISVTFLAFGYFIFKGSILLLDAVYSPSFAEYAGGNIRPILDAIPAVALTTLFVGTLITSFGVLLQALYLSGDMDFLLATPVPIRAVFIAKMLQAILPNVAFIALFGLPLLFGMGASNGYHILYYPLVIVAMIVLALAAAGLSSLLVMLVVRILPPRRAAEILGFAGAILGFTCGQSGNLMNSMSSDLNFSGTRLTGMLLLANTPWFPLNWAGQGLVAFGEGRWLWGLSLIIAALGLSSAAFWFALVTAERWYYSGWAGMQVIARKKPVRSAKPSNTVSKAGSMFARILPKPVLAIVQKDFLTLTRDLRHLSQLVTPVIFGIMYTFIMLRSGNEPPAGKGEAPDWFMQTFRMVLAYGSVGMSLLVGWMILSRFSGMGFSQEGKNYWMLKASPVRASHLLTAKFLVAYLPTLGLGLVFLVIISLVQGLTALQFLYSLLAIVMCLAGMNGVLLSFGVVGANFTWDDPRKMNAGVLGCFGQIVTMFCLPLTYGLFIAPLGFAEFLDYPIAYGYLFGLIFGTGISLLFATLPLVLVRKRVERLGEG